MLYQPGYSDCAHLAVAALAEGPRNVKSHGFSCSVPVFMLLEQEAEKEEAEIEERNHSMFLSSIFKQPFQAQADMSHRQNNRNINTQTIWARAQRSALLPLRTGRGGLVAIATTELLFALPASAAMRTAIALGRELPVACG